MRRLLALIGITAPNEARFFQFVAALAASAAIVYWFVSYELAGTVLLTGFTLASGIVGVLLADAGTDWRATGGAPHDPERPLLDEGGRLPSPTLAPFALGVGLSIAATALVFGPAPLIVGALPLAWGAFDWLRRSGAEMRALERPLDRPPATDDHSASRPDQPGARGPHGRP